MGVLGQLEPEAVFRYFEEICAIPHGSTDTKRISDYLVKFAKERNLAYRQDALGNVIIRKAATPGYESAPVVMLQGHMDMVCEKTDDKTIDFHTQGIDLVLDGNVIRADRTTLGGDDGIAVAFALAILDSKEIIHPPLEVVITVDEEIGMLGATLLDMSDLQAKYMLNLDSEDEGQLLVGCAGGVTATCYLPADMEARPESGWFGCFLGVDGLVGGHSGTEIIRQRANANKLLGRCLTAIRDLSDIRLVSVDGGKKDNAIPRSASAIFLAEESKKDSIQTCMKKMQQMVAAEYAASDPDIRLMWTQVEPTPDESITKACSDAIVDALFLLPDGVVRMNPDIPGLVQTSLNLGILTPCEKEGARRVQLGFSVRSSVGSEKELLTKQLRLLCKRLGGVYTESGAYPAWEYKKESKLRDIMVNAYERLYGEKPRLDVIHAGVECGLFTARMPQLDCVSYGPQMYDIHTPNERLHVDSVQRTWKYTLEVLKDIARSE